MKFRPAIAALSMTLALVACGELPFGLSEPEAPAHSGPPTVSPLEQPIETGAESKPVSTAEAATLNTPIIRASGNEPFWAVTASGNTAVYERPGARSAGVSVRRIPYARGVEFIGVMNGRAFSLNVQAAECTDSMSGQKLPFTARLSAAGQRVTGCAGPAETMPKAQVRASTGTASPRASSSRPAATPAPARPAATTTQPATTTTPIPSSAQDSTDAADTATTPATESREPETPETKRIPAATAREAVPTPAETPATSAPSESPAETEDTSPAPSTSPAPTDAAPTDPASTPATPVVPQAESESSGD